MADDRRVGARLDDPTLMKSDYQVAVGDRRVPMGDNNNRSTLTPKLLDGLEDGGFGFIVQRAGRFVEDKHGRALVDSPRNTKPLALTSG